MSEHACVVCGQPATRWYTPGNGPRIWSCGQHAYREVMDAAYAPATPTPPIEPPRTAVSDVLNRNGYIVCNDDWPTPPIEPPRTAEGAATLVDRLLAKVLAVQTEFEYQDRHEHWFTGLESRGSELAGVALEAAVALTAATAEVERCRAVVEAAAAYAVATAEVEQLERLSNDPAWRATVEAERLARVAVTPDPTSWPGDDVEHILMTAFSSQIRARDVLLSAASAQPETERTS